MIKSYIPRRGGYSAPERRFIMAMTINGVTTCNTIGQENYEAFADKRRNRTKTFMAYDYRHIDGELFSCIKPTLEECRAARDAWIAQKN